MIKLVSFLKPYKIAVVAVIIFGLLQVLGELFLPKIMADVVNNGVLTGDTGYIWKLGGYMLLVSIIATVFSILASYYAARVSSKFGYDVRLKVFEHIEMFSLNEVNTIGTSSLINRTTNDVTQVQNLVMMVLRMMVMAPLMCIGGIIMAVQQNQNLSNIFIIVLPILILTIFLIMRNAMPHFKQLQVKIDRLNLIIRENLMGVRVIRAFSRTHFEQNRFDKANKSYMDTAVKVNQIMALAMPLMMLIMNISTIAIVWFGSKRIDMGDMNVGDLMAFIQYGMQIMFSLLMMSMMLVMIPRAQVSAQRIQEVLELEPSVATPIVSQPININKQRDIVFNHVSFTYPGAESAAVEDITFTSKVGEVTAIIGGTGSGKSTLLNLIQRFYDCTEGDIFYAGSSITQLPLEKYRAELSFIPQKALLFSGTITDNIKVGKENASDEEIQRAAQIAQAENFINELEGTYNYSVSQGGTNLSGGQKQRLAIARAIVREPKVYLFDDSFSALDYKTDAALRQALKAVVKDAVVIVVAQRVSTVMDADQIIVLDEGKISSIGTHDQLLVTSSVYREIVQSQLSEEETV